MQERASPVIFIVLCLGLLAFTVYQFSEHLLFFSTGWDYQTYVSAVRTLDHMQNPYNLQELVRYQLFAPHLAFDYPPHTLYFLWVLDLFFIFHTITIYYALLAALLLISGYLLVILDHQPMYLFLLTLLLTAFCSTFWNFLTGNTGILFLFLFSVLFTLLAKEKYRQSSIVMGISAAFSLFTAPFVLLFLVVKRPIKERLVLIAISTGIVASLFVVSYFISPSLLFSYVRMMLGSGSPFLDGGGWNTPTPYLLLREALGRIAVGGLVLWALVSCIYAGLILYAGWRYCRNNAADTLKILALVMLVLFMVLPRLKPYNYIILVVPLYILFKDCSYRIQTLVLLVISLLPSLIWAAKYQGMEMKTLPFWLGEYIQVYSLILVFVLLILHDHMTKAAEDSGKSTAE